MPWSRRSFIAMLPVAGLGLPSLAGRAAGGRGSSGTGGAKGRPRPRQAGVRIGRLEPGPLDAITDVEGVEVGHETLRRGKGTLVPGVGPVRTGVTAIWPSRDVFERYLPCGVAIPNGNGELTGLVQAERLGVLGTPLLLTGTASVGTAYQALDELRREAVAEDGLPALTPVVGETWDGELGDVAGRHVRAEHVRRALESATGGPVAEGSVGGGTGMICYGFKGGIGTASRRVEVGSARHTVGALVQANHGHREHLRIDGVAVGEAFPEATAPGPATPAAGSNSILMILATDAPLLPHQLARLARRATHGLAKTGSISSNSSGDFALALSTADPIPRRDFWAGDGYRLRSVEQLDLQPLLEAAAEATEAAIVAALFAAAGEMAPDGDVVLGLPIEPTLELLRRHGRLASVDEGGRS